MDAQKLMALGESADPSDCGLRVHGEKSWFDSIRVQLQAKHSMWYMYKLKYSSQLP